MAQPYDRTRYYLGIGDFVKILGFQGEAAFFKIGLSEPMSQQTVLFADENAAVGPAATSDSDAVSFVFNQPVQELRLAQVRPVLFPNTKAPAAIPPVNLIPPTIQLEASSPKSKRVMGTDKITTVTMNGIPNVVGGTNGGRMPANQIRRRDDPNEVFDLWIIKGYDLAFNILNGTLAPIGGGLGPLQYIWSTGDQGRRYVLGKPTPEELKGLKEGVVPYRAITLGGITQVSMGV